MIDDLFAELSLHVGQRHGCDCDRDWERVEHRLALLQQEVAELLRRVPAPDLIPATVTVTAS